MFSRGTQEFASFDQSKLILRAFSVENAPGKCFSIGGLLGIVDRDGRILRSTSERLNPLLEMIKLGSCDAITEGYVTARGHMRGAGLGDMRGGERKENGRKK